MGKLTTWCAWICQLGSSLTPFWQPTLGSVITPTPQTKVQSLGSTGREVPVCLYARIKIHRPDFHSELRKTNVFILSLFVYRQSLRTPIQKRQGQVTHPPMCLCVGSWGVYSTPAPGRRRLIERRDRSALSFGNTGTWKCITHILRALSRPWILVYVWHTSSTACLPENFPRFLTMKSTDVIGCFAVYAGLMKQWFKQFYNTFQYMQCDSAW